MKYKNTLIEGIFIERRNRFVAEVEIKGKRTFAHVPNTGRCKELFVPGARVYLHPADNPDRKYAYTLCIVDKGDMLVHIDSAGANRLMEEALKEKRLRAFNDLTAVEREKSFLHSRFDFRFQRGEKVCYMEVKGVTLEVDGVAKFPDAPTERGARHIEELIAAKAQGYGAYVVFVIQMKGVSSFTPFTKRDPLFAANLQRAYDAGVGILAYDTLVTPAEITLDRPVPIILPQKEGKDILC